MNEEHTELNTSSEAILDDQPKAGKGKTFLREVWELGKIIIVSLLIVLPVRLFVAQPFIVRGASMEPNFHNGEYLIVDELSYHLREPVRGEVIVFRYPQDPSQFFIKRIIGLPGDTITLRGGSVIITNEEYPDGAVLHEDYLPHTITTTPDSEVYVEDGAYFVMGDNRIYSSDSRRWGLLEQDLLIGRAFLRLWPIGDIAILKQPVK